MSGNYPDAPGPRMAYDRDGTQVYKIDQSSVVTQASATEIKNMNDEDDATSMATTYGSSGATVWIFPETRDLKGFYFAVVASFGGVQMSSPVLAVSADTTNGLDGTWTTVSTNGPDLGQVRPTKPGYRTSVATANATGIKAVKLSGVRPTGGISAFTTAHFYGARAATGDRLDLWHPTLNQTLAVTPAFLDWGNRPRGTSATKQFRIKNLSAALTANTITVGVEALTDASPTVVSQTTLSTDGTTFTPTVTIPAIPPGSVSGIITVKQDLLTTAVLSLWTQRLYASAGSWT